jgi:16S rRNA (cytosine1402-N4)-methyltransferase
VPVLPAEVLAWLDPQPGQAIVDATLGGGGHARLIAQRLGQAGRLIGIDQDASMLERAKPVVTGCQVTLIHRNFGDLRTVLDDLEVDRVDGVLADLGFASDQMADPQRGFSFQQEGPLDMRLNPEQGEPASAWLADLSERELADIFWRYGEERFSRRIARRIVERREREPIVTTVQLAELVRRCVPRQRSGIDPATRVFQALRIVVNDELGALERLLKTLPDCLRSGGRAVIIGFHSLEDRLVKQAFKKPPWTVLTKKPVTPTAEEIRNNPRTRSAKLRAAKIESEPRTERSEPRTE